MDLHKAYIHLSDSFLICISTRFLASLWITVVTRFVLAVSAWAILLSSLFQFKITRWLSTISVPVRDSSFNIQLRKQNSSSIWQWLKYLLSKLYHISISALVLNFYHFQHFPGSRTPVVCYFPHLLCIFSLFINVIFTLKYVSHFIHIVQHNPCLTKEETKPSLFTH